MTKTAFIAIVGKPNVGKSSLLNKMLGAKVAIVSSKPQTTRTKIMGVLTLDETQLVFTDTPGFHKPHNKLGEYMNNAVTEVPGLDEATPLGQGGHVIINGAPSNQTFSVLKPERGTVDSAKVYAENLGGKVLNVALINASIRNFQTATVNFYLKGIAAGQNIKVYQLIDGVWVELTVSEIREDHMVVNMTSLGTLAFIEVPVTLPIQPAQ